MKNFSLSTLLKVSLALAGLTIFLFAAFLIAIIKLFPTSEFTTQGIFLRSWESKTIHGEPVYNSIKYIKQVGKEIWMMNQSHHGFTATSEKWDRLAIVIENKTANFYQLPPGPLEWTEYLVGQKIDLKVDCRQCHSNGPRAIRPAPDFKSLMTTMENATLFLLNVRMKFYGKLQSNLWTPTEILPEKSFTKITLQTCLHCHNNGNKPWNRAQLTVQQRDTIRFLLENNLMPPSGFALSDDERLHLQNFLTQVNK